jgi:hypothetical protein
MEVSLLARCPTARVTRWWAGVDSIREQEKLEVKKMLVNRADSHQSGARCVRQRFAGMASGAEKKHRLR